MLLLQHTAIKSSLQALRAHFLVLQELVPKRADDTRQAIHISADATPACLMYRCSTGKGISWTWFFAGVDRQRHFLGFFLRKFPEKSSLHFALSNTVNNVWRVVYRIPARVVMCARLRLTKERKLVAAGKWNTNMLV